MGPNDHLGPRLRYPEPSELQCKFKQRIRCIHYLIPSTVNLQLIFWCLAVLVKSTCASKLFEHDYSI